MYVCVCVCATNSKPAQDQSSIQWETINSCHSASLKSPLIELDMENLVAKRAKDLVSNVNTEKEDPRAADVVLDALV